MHPHAPCFTRYTLTQYPVSSDHAGGGIANRNGNAVIRRSLIIANTAGSVGGGIVNRDNGNLTVRRLITANTAGDVGGGIFNESGTVIVRRSLIIANTPDECVPEDLC